MYRDLGYFDVVREATEVSMSLAVGEAQEMPQYPLTGEVYIMHVHVMVGKVSICSGLSPTQDTIRQLTHITLLCPVYQEGIYYAHNYTHTCLVLTQYTQDRWYNYTIVDRPSDSTNERI